MFILKLLSFCFEAGLDAEEVAENEPSEVKNDI